MLSFMTLHQVVKCDQACMHINDQKLVMQLETDVGSELPMASFNVPHPGPAQLSKLIFSNNQLCTLCPSDGDWVRESLLNAFNLKCTVFYTSGLFLHIAWGLSNCVRGVYFVSQICFFLWPLGNISNLKLNEARNPEYTCLRDAGQVWSSKLSCL